MKKLKQLRGKIITLLSLLCADEFCVVTFHHQKDDYYVPEYRHSFPVAEIDNKGIIHCMFENFQVEFKHRKMDAQVDKAREILNK